MTLGDIGPSCPKCGRQLNHAGSCRPLPPAFDTYHLDGLAPSLILIVSMVLIGAALFMSLITQ
jgi:hypothetical protein